MGQDSKIEWTHHTFNPWRGCTKVSAGCEHCYAERQSKRNPAVLGEWGPQGKRVVASDAAWREPMKWNKEAAVSGERHRVFCASLADVFEDWPGLLRRNEKGEAVALWHGPAKPGAFGLCTAGQMLVDPSRKQANGRPVLMDGYRWATLADVRARLIALIFCTPHLDWLLLTKRPENVVRMWDEAEAASGLPDPVGIGGFENVWIGTSVENQATADARVPELMKIPAAVRFLSCEPMLGPVDLKVHFAAKLFEGIKRQFPDMDESRIPQHLQYNGPPSPDWVICGGESGGGARPMHPDWARGLRDQCQAAGVPFFFKQVGSNVHDRNDRGFEAENEWYADGPKKGRPIDPEAWPTPKDVEHGGERYQGAPVRVRLHDPKGGDPDEWPEDLRVREFPAAKEVRA